MPEVVAIMRGVHVGLRDVGRPCMWFETYTSESSGALQVLTWEEAGKVLQASGAYDVKELEGAPCWVEDDDNLIKFVRVWDR